MTVSYTAEVAHSSWFGCFLKLLLRWRASIYKLIWLDVGVYIATYYVINGTYRYLMNAEQKKSFEKFVKYCNECSALIPLMFVLGFYVSIVIRRWWEQYMTLPWPDSTAVYVSALIQGNDDVGRKMRRTIMRYVCLSLTLVLSMISPRVKRRFPTLDHFVDVGLMVENEKIILKNLNEKFAKYPKHWMPIVWAASILTKARKQGRIRDDSSLKTLIDSLNSFRGMCNVLLFYDTISIPLVYTQVVTIAVYTYLLTTIFGHQWIGQTDEDGLLNIVDYLFPFFPVLEYLFFMGWLKVAESLICPFGDDDDDFEVNWLIDRNLQVSYMIVDEMHNEHPDLVKDQYWEEIFPKSMPYETAGAVPEEPPKHSTADWEKQQEKKITFKVPLLASVSHYFARGNASYDTENLNDTDADQQGSEEEIIEFETSLSRQNLEPSELSEETKTEEEDEFEKLKRQRQQERISRQMPIITITEKTDETEEKSASEEYKSKTSSSSHTSQASKKFN